MRNTNTQKKEGLNKRMTLYLDTETWDKLTYVAESEQRSKNNLIYIMINNKFDEILNIEKEEVKENE